MKHTISVLAIVTILLCLPGCTRLVDWGRDCFYQGQELHYNKELARRYIRSATIYDQMVTRGHFDVIWLSDEVRTTYAYIYTNKFGRSEEKHLSFEQKQLAENQHFIVFYLLSSIESLFYDHPLSEWSLYLEIEGKNIEPLEVKAFELEPEYKAFFGKRYNRFRIPYRVTFPAKDVDGSPFLSRDGGCMRLHLQSLEKKTVFSWNTKNGLTCGNVKKGSKDYEDCHRCGSPRICR